MRRRLVLLLAVLALVAAACGDDDSAGPTTTAVPTTTAPTTETPTTQAPTTTVDDMATEVTLTSGDLGEFLADGEGFTLYLFTPDEQSGESNCYDDCAALWPPLIGEVTAGDGVDASLLDTTERDDGSIQATYNDWPLYHYAPDAAPGDTNGQGLNDVWFVVDAEGNAIGADMGEEAAGPALEVAGGDLGDHLVDADGNTVYLFMPDAQGDPTCFGDCAQNWPPLTEAVAAGEGADDSLLGTASRDGAYGVTQVTYNGWPLYYFAGDSAPGDTNGQGVGDVWFMVDPEGNPLGAG